MKPVHICGSDDAIVIGKTRFGGYALRNVTRTVRGKSVPKMKAQLSLMEAAYNSYGKSWDEVITAVAANSGIGRHGGLSLEDRRRRKHERTRAKIERYRGMIGGAAPARVAIPAM